MLYLKHDLLDLKTAGIRWPYCCVALTLLNCYLMQTLLCDCLDVKDIKVVVNYDFPSNMEDYVHRIGRTGRAGARGTAFSFFTHGNAKYTRELIKILQQAGQVVPPQLAALARGGGSDMGGKHCCVYYYLNHKIFLLVLLSYHRY